MFCKNTLGLFFVLLISTSSLTLAMKGEDEGTQPLQTYPRKHPLKTQKRSNEKLTLENFPTQTTCLKNAFELVIELFEHNLSHIQFMDGLLKEVMSAKTSRVEKFKEYFGKIKLSFEKGQYVKGFNLISLENHCAELSSLHQAIIQKYKTLINKLKERIDTIDKINEICEKNKVLPDVKFFAQAANIFIEFFTEYKNGETEKLNKINEGYNKFKKRKNKIAEIKTPSYTKFFEEDYLITTLSDIVVFFSKAIEILAPYSSHPPENRDNTKTEQEKEPLEIQIGLNKKNNKSKEKRDRKRLQAQHQATKQNKSPSLTSSAESDKSLDQEITHPNSLPLLEDNFNKTEKVAIKEKEPQIQLPILQENISFATEDKTSFFSEPQEKQTQLPQKINETNPSSIETENTHSFKAPNTLPTNCRPKRSRKRKPIKDRVSTPSLSTTLQINKRNFRTLEEIFTHPITNCTSMDSFDTLIESEAGFRGRVYGGHRSHIYEIFLLLNEEQKPIHFLSFKEFQKGKKEKHLLKKYSFTLHRPHLHGKNKKGKTRNMYPQLMTLARQRLEDFKLTPDTITSK